MNLPWPPELTLALLFVLPLLIGLIVWIVKDKQNSALQLQHEQQLAQQQSEHERHVSQLQQAHDGQLAELKQEQTRILGELDTERRVAQEKITALKQAEQTMSEHFKALSGDVLQKSSEQFLQLARQNFEKHQEHADQSLKQREKSIESLIQPIAEALKKTEAQIQAVEKDRHAAFGSLNKQIEIMAQSQQQLQLETRNLVTALRRPEVRGQWGELTLKRLVELAGMVEYCDFYEQEQAHDGQRQLRPDMIVRLPDQRELIVDAKTPLDAYLNATEAQDQKHRDHYMIQHAKNVRERMKELASKAYWSQFKHSPDYVVLFIPGEQFLTGALEHDGKLLEDALANRVVLATPTTIIALLRAVAFGWRQMEVAENAERIQQLGEDLYKRVATFVEHLSRLGKNLSGSVEAYNKAIGSLERQVLPGARKFHELGLQSKKEIPEAKTLEVTPRTADHLNPQDGDE